MQALAAPAAGHPLIVVRITLAGDGRRHHPEGAWRPDLAPGGRKSPGDFQLDFARQYFIIEVSAGLVAEAASLAGKHGLRGYDAVQLAAALEIHAKLPSLTLALRDAELNAAATAEGLSVDDPNNHP